ncbi:MAG: hypothetical protein RML46_04955 [Anaerolineae bacterium]|nr:hypothetical protein [Anaerolineae bacterium]MDW8068242.1 hypothetical protein [Anaerolineae bacterium]
MNRPLEQKGIPEGVWETPDLALPSPGFCRIPSTVASVSSPLPTPSDTPFPQSTATSMPSPTWTPSPLPAPSPTASPTRPVSPPAVPATPASHPVAPTFTPVPPFEFAPPPGREFATLEEFWSGQAEWVLEEWDTGLPMGESDTVYRGGQEFWSYLHASFASAGVRDPCGDPVEFPGCVTLWKSYDGGRRFVLEQPVCLLPCHGCPCDYWRDHVWQQQYPRVFFDRDRVYMVYETIGAVYLRVSPDGLRWSHASKIPGTGWSWGCKRPEERVGTHPFVPNEAEYGECLVGAPPGLYVEGSRLYVFVGLGRSPGHMGCLVGNKYQGAGGLRRCAANPLFGAENGYGPLDVVGPAANPFFEFRTISSADVVRVEDRYYMVYEGVRGPSAEHPGDHQFGLGLARSVGPEIDGPWEKFPGNPILMDLPGNIGVGHGDLVIVGPATYLYTATSPTTRGRYVLVRR